MAYSSSSARDLVSQYRQMNSLPAVMSALWLISSLYGFGGMEAVSLTWINYTLSPSHATLGGLAVYLVAFMSSETKQFENYESWEQAFIIGGPALFAADAYFPEVSDFLVSIGDPIGHQLAFLATTVAWMVAVR
jgi:hypothetical protein